MNYWLDSCRNVVVFDKYIKNVLLCLQNPRRITVDFQLIGLWTISWLHFYTFGLIFSWLEMCVCFVFTVIQRGKKNEVKTLSTHSLLPFSYFIHNALHVNQSIHIIICSPSTDRSRGCVGRRYKSCIYYVWVDQSFNAKQVGDLREMLMLIALTFQTCHVQTLMAGTVGWVGIILFRRTDVKAFIRALIWSHIIWRAAYLS